MGRLFPTAFIVLAIAIIAGIVIPYGWYMGMMLMIGATMSTVLLYLVVDGFIRLGRANDDRWWTSLPQLTGPALGVVGLLFTAVYQQRDIDEKASSRQLAAANLKVSQAQFLSSLPELLQSDAVRREAGLFMVELLDARLGAVFASSFAVRDSEQNVRLSAKDILENLTLSPDPDTARIARQGLEQYQRHVSKEIIGDLADAKGKLRSGLYTHCLTHNLFSINNIL